MVYHVTMVTFLMTLLMNTSTSIVMGDWHLDEIQVNYESFVNYASQHFCRWNTIMDDWNVDEESLSKWQQLQHCKFVMPKYLYKKWQIILGSHLVLVTRHGRFQISNWARQMELVTRSPLFSIQHCISTHTNSII